MVKKYGKVLSISHVFITEIIKEFSPVKSSYRFSRSQ